MPEPTFNTWLERDKVMPVPLNRVFTRLMFFKLRDDAGMVRAYLNVLESMHVFDTMPKAERALEEVLRWAEENYPDTGWDDPKLIARMGKRFYESSQLREA